MKIEERKTELKTGRQTDRDPSEGESELKGGKRRSKMQEIEATGDKIKKEGGGGGERRHIDRQ